MSTKSTTFIIIDQHVLYKSLRHSAVVVFINKYGIMSILRVIIINIITHVYVWLHIYDTANGAYKTCACLHIYSSHQNPFQTNHWLGMTQHQLEEKRFSHYVKIAKTNTSNMIT